MREPHIPDPMPPRDWSEAFSALTPETPPADALSGVFAQLPASTPTRPGRQWWIAAAAVLALAAVFPLAMNVARHSYEGQSRNAEIASARHSGAASDSRTAVQSRPLSTDARLSNPAPAIDPGIKKLGPGLPRDDNMGTVAVRSDAATAAVAIAPAEHSTPVRVAKADPPRRKPHRTHEPTATEPSDGAMEPLYAESARLEALLALARDDRAASATVVALGSDFGARVAGIDAALAQPSLTAQRRLELWRDRVSALRAYASFESTQRALAASGERYDAMLVSID
jgi:hypothetical protein